MIYICIGLVWYTGLIFSLGVLTHENSDTKFRLMNWYEPPLMIVAWPVYLWQMFVNGFDRYK